MKGATDQHADNLQARIGDLLTFLKGSRRAKDDLRDRNPTLYEHFQQVWDIRARHMIKQGDINRDRPERTNVKAIRNTLKLHSIRGISPYVVMARERSCFCPACTTDRPVGECQHTDITGEWEECYLLGKTAMRSLRAPGTGKK